MNKEDIRRDQLELLKILEAFDKFCKDNNVTYFLYAGTALGAVREKGFIAWDGDIDIMMSFSEYKRLNELAEKSGINGYKWVTYKTDKHIPTFCAKIYDANVSAENLEDFPYIEITPFVGAPKKTWLRNLVWKISLWNYDVYWVKNRIYRHNLKRRHNQIGMLAKIAFFWWPSKLAAKIYESLCEKWPLDEAEEAIHLTNIYPPKRHAIPVQWLFEEPVYVEFEGKPYPVLKEWDAFLKKMYGDYMTPVQYGRYK